MPGIDKGRFKKQPLNSNFVCSICQGVLVDPVQRLSCQHVYCRDCITNWLLNQNTCPIDRQPLTRNYLIQAPRLLRQLVGELEVCCDHRDRGCDDFVALEDLQRHVKNCPFGPSFPVSNRTAFESSILRAKEIMSGSHSVVSQLLRILDEKEKLVKEQEKLIARILEEGEDINKIMKEFTEEKEKLQREKEDDMQRFKDVIERLKRENEELKVRLTENRVKLLSNSDFSSLPPTINNTNDATLKLVTAVNRRERSVSPTGNKQSLTMSIEHKETMRRIRSKIPDKVYKAMSKVDLGTFYQIEPYSLTWASYIAERVKREAVLVNEADKVLVMCCWSDLYIPVCLSMIVGPSGCVVTRGYSEPEIDRVHKEFPALFEEGRLVIVLENEDDSVLKEGFPEKSPFDVIFVPRAHYTAEIEEQRKPHGLAYDPYEQVNLTPIQDRNGEDLEKVIPVDVADNGDLVTV
ncbi:E3 ubiquitin-protein ligase NRDP1 [Halotydeus destructor]|nr:E3 ubiquitin-protein ligase NRDP1 [Halotydeus destructor]